MGVLMILMALQVFGAVNIIPHIHMSEKMTKKGYAGAFLTGAVGGVMVIFYHSFPKKGRKKGKKPLPALWEP